MPLHKASKVRKSELRGNTLAYKHPPFNMSKPPFQFNKNQVIKCVDCVFARKGNLSGECEDCGKPQFECCCCLKCWHRTAIDVLNSLAQLRPRTSQQLLTECIEQMLADLGLNSPKGKAAIDLR